jgi:energy-coupling factor transporter ATP-binding protein EcfA2
MLLKRFTIRDFQSIRDSNVVEAGDITCLVGKNEAGKTALLRALYRLSPINAHDNRFDVTDDYPRSRVTEYEREVKTGRRSHAIVTRAVFTLEPDELAPIEERFGSGVIPFREITLTRGYDNKTGFELVVDERIAGETLLRRADLADAVQQHGLAWHSLEDLADVLERRANTPPGSFEAIRGTGTGFTDAEGTATAIAPPPRAQDGDTLRSVQTDLRSLTAHGLATHIWHAYLAKHVPMFLYFDEYHQIRGCENIEALRRRMADERLLPSDHPLIGLIELAGLELEELVNPERTQDLKNRLQGAGNYLTGQILKYWSQNKHLRLSFDVRPARPGDPEGMRSGTNIWAEVVDQRHYVNTPLAARSRGFVWFFSFLAWYSRMRTSERRRVILLMDEPGLSLHARAQGDLLRYFEQELRGGHQLLYATHSPFMIDSKHLERVRIVQDKTVDADEVPPAEQEGTKVIVDVLDADPDSLFPLQGALGREIYDGLFVGSNALVVEGSADLLFIQAMSSILAANGKTELSPAWTITPIGGADRLPTFVALMEARGAARMATLIDLPGTKSRVFDDAGTHQLLSRSRILTFGQFVGKPEAGIEDMFEPDFYLDLVNREYAKHLLQPIKLSDLNLERLRIRNAIEEYLKTHPLRGAEFSAYRPARFFVEKNMGTFALKFSTGTLDRFEQAFGALNRLVGD